MLRIIVISLFVANLLLLAFQTDKPVTQKQSVVRQTRLDESNIPTIHLFNELAKDQDLMSGNRQCFSLGPFHSSEERDETHAQLRVLSSMISERQTEALVEKGFWVFIPPYGSLLEANHELIMLQARGLKDIRVMYEGDWKNAISLGYFLRQENAQRRQKDLEKRGYAPQIRVQRQSESRYWLDYEQTPGSALITLDMTNRPNDFMQRSLPCPEENVLEVADDSADSADDTGPTFIFKSNSGSQRAENVEIDAGLSAEMSPDDGADTAVGDGAHTPADDGADTSADDGADGSADDGGVILSDDKLEFPPGNRAATPPDGSMEAGPAQSVEPEPQTGSETETDGG